MNPKALEVLELKKSTEIIGLSVISIQEGKQLGVVKNLIIDATSKAIAALIVEDGNWYLGAKALPFPSISGIGEHAITTNSEKDILDISAFDHLLSAEIQVIGSIALSDKGNLLGQVYEITIDDSGTIAECFIKAEEEVSTVSLQQIITFGKNVTIISTEPRPQIYSAAAPVEQVIQLAKETPVTASSVIQNAVDINLSGESYDTQVDDKEEEITLPEPNEPILNQEQKTADSEPDALAKLFEEKQRQYMLGKHASRKILAENGLVIIEQGEVITEAVLEKAKQAGKFVELSMSIF